MRIGIIQNRDHMIDGGNLGHTQKNRKSDDQNLIENISDTARWVAHYRALESARPDALFRDPLAALLAGERGANIVRQMPGARFGGWMLTVRTIIIYQMILQLITDRKIDGVLNLAAGLDTRPYRLDLPAELEWIEVDLPAITTYKERLLVHAKARCHLRRLAIDLSDRKGRQKLFNDLNQNNKRWLVLTEGFIVYLPEEAVQGLAEDLARQGSFQYWIQDYTSSASLWLLDILWGRTLKAAQAPLIFAPRGGPKYFESWGWNPSEVRSFFDEGRKVKRELPLASLAHLSLKLLPLRARKRLTSSSGIVLLNRSY